jgi:uncharacterized protein (DUF2235 family)
VCILARAIESIAKPVNVGATSVDSVDQIVYYQAGVGTSFGKVLRLYGTATGDGLDQNIREGYGFIVHNWQPGDEIYLFGFSRGAFTARSISGLISEFGLLTKRGMDGFWDVMSAYQKGNFKHSDPKREENIKKLGDRYERAPATSPDKQIPIKFIGVWDTVAAIGLPEYYIFNINVQFINWWIRAHNKKSRYEDTTLHANVEYAFHAYYP